MGIWYKQGVVLPPNSGDLNGGSPLSGTANCSVLHEGNAQILSGTVFKMWFEGGNNVYYAESLDGLSWTRRPTALLTGFGFPKIFKNGSTYYLYVGNPPNGSGAVSVYTSSDGVNFTLQSATALSPSASGWDSAGVLYLCPFFIDSGGNWFGSYTSSNSLSGPWAMGIATSTDGIHWTNAASPSVDLLLGTEVHLVGGTFYAWGGLTTLGQAGGAPDLDPQDGARAQSADMATWSTPIITLPRTLPDEGAGSPDGELTSLSLVEANGKTYQFYTGTATGNLGLGYQIMLAIANLPLADVVLTNEGMAISFVQSPTPPAFGSHTSYSSTFDSDNTEGNLLFVAALVADTSGETLSISDTQGNSYIVPSPDTGTNPNNNGAQTCQVWICTNCKAGPNTVTVSLSGAAKVGSIFVLEYAGANNIDRVGMAVAATGTTATSPSETTRHAAELLIGVAANQNGSIANQSIAPGGTGTSIRQSLGSAFSVFDNIVSGIDTFTASATQANGNWTAGLFAIAQGSFVISGNAGVAGARITYSGTQSGFVIADGSGNYQTPMLMPGFYNIVPSKSGFSFSPSNQLISISVQDVPGVNFAATPGPNAGGGGGGFVGKNSFGFGFGF